MPSQIPATFASAAASNGQPDGGSSVRGGGVSDWSRTRPNGATQTFRRPSQPANTSGSRDAPTQQSSSTAPNIYVPPHISASMQQSSARTSSSSEHRYSKEQLLEHYKAMGHYGGELENVLTEGWQPGASANASNGAWSRRDDNKENGTGPDICWDATGAVAPLGLLPMAEEEKTLFQASVNSPLKPPSQNASKDTVQTPGVNGRKSSISQTPGSGSHTGSLSGSRPGARRRETSDAGSSINSMASPTSFRSTKEEGGSAVKPPASLLRRRTDYKEGSTGPSFGERARLETGLDPSTPTGFKRTGPLSASINPPSSPWAAGPQSASFGSFGNFGADNSSAQPGTPGDKKMGFGSVRGESRFKGLMSKDSVEDVSKNRERQNLSLLGMLDEVDRETQSATSWSQGQLGRRPLAQGSSILDELDQRIGSAALGGDEPELEQPYISSIDQRRTHEETGFSSLGAGGEPSFRNSRAQETPQSHLQVGGNFHEPMSPTNTNPYQSPEGDRTNDGNETDDDRQSNPYSNRGPSKPFASGLDAGDRSQTSSAGAGRFGNIGGLGGLSGIGGSTGWSAAPGPTGTSARAGTGFGGTFPESLFGDVSSPATGIFGVPPSAGYGAIGRGSKIGSLFPPNMQDQLRDGHGFGDFGQGRNTNSLGYGAPPRDSNSPARQGHGVLDDLFGNAEAQARSGAPTVSSPFTLNDIQGSAIQNAPQSQAPIAAPIGSTVASPSTSASQDNSAGQMPAAQQRTMVMPDRMRWIYRDPQGNTQGPWSGLEMHDWYKAGFFSPELLVKKQEDTEYEPLAQLIRRIGNSREPFLVPQIGIPHGPSSTQPGVPGSVLSPPTGNTSQGGAAQPPFPSNFPSFGTTLTADQQNALERRKQEEQFLMARQKEHLAQQQSWMRQMQGQGAQPHGMHPQGLHHHSSAHSLQSQPSYGSITSPAAYQASPGPMPMQQQQQQQQPGGPGFYDRPGQQLGGIGNNITASRGSEMATSLDRLSLDSARQGLPGQTAPQQQPQDVQHQQQVAAMLQDRARLQQEQQQAGMQGQLSEQESRERLSQYQLYRAQEEQQMAGISAPIGQQMEQALPEAEGVSADIGEQYRLGPPNNKIAVSAPDPAATMQAPAPSISPLPAPAAQRTKHPVIDTITAGSQSRSQTPVETPTTATLAPWAKENNEGTRGPSLKEIQEAEARKATQQEELATAARRAAALVEQERIIGVQAQVQNTVGLPSAATWAASSPTTVGAPSAWSKKAAVATPVSGGPKKTLSQIQKEEEARKNRAAAAAASASPVAATPGSVGKRYADLASKVASPSGPAGVGGAWTTVGSSGKVKIPVGPAGAGPQRTASGSTVTIPGAKPVAPVRANMGVPSSKQTALDELARWAKMALGKGMNKDINLDDFVRGLLSFPQDIELISDSVYANSETLDGNRFAEEFLRRRKLADKGQVAPDSSGSFVTAGATEPGKNSASAGGAAGGGWSEVARKGEKASEKAAKDREDGGQAFKVVAAKKKGKR